MAVSVAAFGEEQMDKQGVKRIDDLVKLTPGLDLQRGPTGSNNISIRGITSNAGAATTGVYIDDTPIQVRNLGYGSGTAFPQVFDLERVEVLRGPQGTLFGAGSQGGTVRFIQTSPSLDTFSTLARVEGAKTAKGDNSYEAGVAIGGPIVADKLGFRASVSYRRDGGYVDALTGDLDFARDSSGAVLPRPTTAAGFDSNIVLKNATVVEKDANWNDVWNARLAFKLAATDAITLTPSLSYQKRRTNDGGDSYWTSLSRDGDYKRVRFAQSLGSTAGLLKLDVPDSAEGDERFYLASLGANWDLGKFEAVSSTSFFDRKSAQNLDWTRLDALQFAFVLLPTRGYQAVSRYEVAQKNFVQEVRLQSADPNARLRFVAGGFFSHNEQKADQSILNNFLSSLPVVGLGVAGGTPFGAGSTALQNMFGVDSPDGVNYWESRKAVDTQWAGFTQADFKVTEKLTLTGGLRVSYNKLVYDAEFGGPLNNLNAPGGAPCPTGVTCALGKAPFTPAYPSTKDYKVSETAVTPKLSLGYQATSDNLFYASAAKGFRPAGVSPKLPPFCNVDLNNLGYIDSSGAPNQPLTFKSDTVWSYEVGSKNRFLGGALTVDASAFQINWKGIQSQVFLPTCFYDFVDNLGDATARGFDIAVQARPIQGLTLSGSVGYTKSSFDHDARTPGGIVFVSEGSAIQPDMAPWNVNLSAQYEFSKYYIRADYTYTDKRRPQGATDPASPNYNPLRKPAAAFDLVNARVGGYFGDADVSLFVNNLTNDHPSLGKQPDRFAFDQVWIDTTVRPRTLGVTVTYRR
ncbi:TonB-dependent receptor [Caulobacter sp. SL161]|uniref:TonB-dependent receptor n=1 Tax=Caulobacter sp. SL161 TaxID=2995156 RepID=UPI00227593A2|nr:TonB-dependent receptor [Caulobacter sp. SL161]MCY1646618.1 TonB-dependent receptor [Caulobacter sp. SL161]